MVQSTTPLLPTPNSLVKLGSRLFRGYTCRTKPACEHHVAYRQSDLLLPSPFPARPRTPTKNSPMAVHRDLVALRMVNGNDDEKGDNNARTGVQYLLGERNKPRCICFIMHWGISGMHSKLWTFLGDNVGIPRVVSCNLSQHAAQNRCRQTLETLTSSSPSNGVKKNT